MIPIRALQHYAYCPHRWGMLYMEGRWAENAHTVKGDLLHENVHREALLRSSGAGMAFGGVSLYSERLGIYGKADRIELLRCNKGTAAAGAPCAYRVRMIEYKPTAPKGEILAAERLQLYAQTCCAQEIFQAPVEACMYYADTRRRVAVAFDEEDEAFLQRILSAIRSAQESGALPPIVLQKGCSGCSMAGECMSRVKTANVREAIRRCLCESS